MKNMKKKLILSILILILNFGIFTYVKADSGWDTDYDSGSSWDSDSSWDSGSSWDSSSSWDDYDSSSSYSSSSNHSSSNINAIKVFIYLLILIYVTILIASKISNITKAKPVKNVGYYDEWTDDRVHIILPDLNIKEFKEKAYEIYKNIQIAWMNFDYDTLKNLVTDEMYNMYKSQLEALKLKQQQNIMEDFELEHVKIIGVEKISNIVSIKTLVKVSFYDYVINTKTNEVVRGNKNKKVLLEYEIVYTQSLSKIDKCPNCGGELDDKNEVCLYCRSRINKLSNNFVISKKRNIFQTYK